MKKLFVSLTLFASVAATAQTKPTAVKKPVAKPAASVAPALKNLNDSASYAVGVMMASFYKQQGITNLNSTLVSRAISDVSGGKKLLLPDTECNDVLMRYVNKAQTAKSAPNIQAGEQFLAQNKSKPNIKTTASGLQYEVVTEGTGAKPTATDTVVCHYKGTLIDGTEFDNSYKRGEPITFPVGGVIRGWTEALQLMSVGSKYKLYIPQQLAYGTNDMGTIPAGSVLLFDVELLEVKGK